MRIEIECCVDKYRLVGHVRNGKAIDKDELVNCYQEGRTASSFRAKLTPQRIVERYSQYQVPV